MSVIKTECFILKRKALNNRDISLQVFGRSCGRIFVKIASSQMKRYYLSQLGHVELSFSEKGGRIYDSLLLEDFKQLAGDLNKLDLVAYMLTQITRVTVVGEKNELLFDLFKELVYSLLSDVDISKLRSEFQQKLLQIEGVAPAKSVTNREFETIIEGYIQGVFAEAGVAE